MRRMVLFAVFALLPATLFAGNADFASAAKLADLQTRAEQARPQDQCFLFAQVISQMTEVADQQIAAGEQEHATATLHEMQRYLDRIHGNLQRDTRKMKDAEILIHRTAFRLNDMAHQASVDDRERLEGMLHRINLIEDELMLHVFEK